MNFCMKCGSALEPNASFCKTCGVATNVGNANPYNGGYNGGNANPYNGGNANPYNGGYNGGNANPYAYGYNGGNANVYNNDETPTIPGFGEAVRICLRNRFKWRGRASRSEYWWFVLFTCLINFLLAILWVGALALQEVAPEEVAFVGVGVVAILWIVWSVVAFFSTLAVMIRRLHDSNCSGACYWFSLIPYVGGLILFILMLRAPTPGPNNYGPQPMKR